MTPRLIVLAGANGCGKATFYRRFLAPAGMVWINADEIAARLWPDDPAGNAYPAAAAAADLRDITIAAGRDFATETVFSHPSKLAMLHNASSHGYRITLIHIHLDELALNLARIAEGTAAGGHPVPADKVAARRNRLPPLIREALAACRDAVLYDNSDDAHPFRLVATLTDGTITPHADPLPDWAIALLPETR